VLAFAGAAGCGAGPVAGATGAVMGVTLTPITLPVTSRIATLPLVPRAARVALAFAAAAAFSSVVSGFRAFFVGRPKSASTVGELPNVPFTYAT
jgi:hypothetical protein